MEGCLVRGVVDGVCLLRWFCEVCLEALWETLWGDGMPVFITKITLGEGGENVSYIRSMYAEAFHMAKRLYNELLLHVSSVSVSDKSLDITSKIQCTIKFRIYFRIYLFRWLHFSCKR